jgi:phosphoribosylamine--glycine ligase
MDQVGILVVSYGAREAAMVDLFSKSEEYSSNLYIADKQRNPFNVKKAKNHQVLPELDSQAIGRFAAKHKNDIDFAIIGPEKPIINGVRDHLENKLGIPTICPTKAYALEGSKVRQRLLLEKVMPSVNVKFKVFDQSDYKSEMALKASLFQWLDELGGKAVVKPDAPAAGKGVGVWGDHFHSREDLYTHFKANIQCGPVIVEEKIEGEESSFQAFCDGAHLVPLPDTRDYKRAFEGDQGPNTGGMGSYKDGGDLLPFLSEYDRQREVQVTERLFQALKGRGSNPNIIGIPFYLAFIHSRGGVKMLEINSRPGDPEIINILPLFEDDFVEICFKILDGNLRRIHLQSQASVVIYKVPYTYAGFQDVYPEQVDKHQINLPIDLNEAQQLADKNPDRMRIYPASVEIKDDQVYPLKSRAICSVGIADSIQSARDTALDILTKVKGGALWHRTDIASQENIEESINHVRRLKENS